MDYSGYGITVHLIDIAAARLTTPRPPRSSERTPVVGLIDLTYLTLRVLRWGSYDTFMWLPPKRLCFVLIFVLLLLISSQERQ